MTLAYPIASNAAHPARLSPDYRSTLKRSPQKPLIIMRHTLSELTGPVYGHETVRENDHDLTTQHTGEPLGERIIVHGHVLDEDGRACRTRCSRSGRPMPAAATSTSSISIRRRSIRISPAPAARKPMPTAITGSSPSSPAPIRGATITTPGARPTFISRCSATPSSRGW